MTVEAPRLLGPQDIALLAAMNIERVPVARRPRVALISTGDELVMPERRWPYLSTQVRDTLSNIREAENGCRVSIHCLRGDMIGAADVQAAARPVPRDTSEWDLISGSAIPDNSGDLLSSAIATIHTKVVEIRKLPESSKAFQVIMLAESIATIPNSEEPTSRLVQISNNVLSGSSDGSTWKFELDW